MIVDEAHRSHYDDLDGYAAHLKDALPNATLIAFTGTPISFADRNTRQVFGDYIDIYDLTRAVRDGATVPVYFEPRLIKVGFAADVSEEDIDAAADEAAVGLDLAERERIERSVAVINAVYGAPERLKALAADIVEHWENRRAQMAPFIDAPGKAMIVGATREICARLYDEIVALRPDWHSDALDKGRIKVVYSGGPQDQPPISQARPPRLGEQGHQVAAARVDDELEIVIVKDMMLTGFDAPPLHTLYLDRPLKGALLMQTLARVNRTFRGKTDGLLTAYAPLADNLNKALAEYTQEDQETRPVGTEHRRGRRAGRDPHRRDRHRVRRLRLEGQARPRPQVLPHRRAGADRLPPQPRHRGEPGGRRRGEPRGPVPAAVRAARPGLGARFGQGHPRAPARRGAVLRRGPRLHGQVRRPGSPVPRRTGPRGHPAAAAPARRPGRRRRRHRRHLRRGRACPNPASWTSDRTSSSRPCTRTNPHLAIEALRDLLTSESRRATRHNLVRQRAFSERLTELMTKYTNQQLTSAEVIAELIALAKEVAAEGNRGQHFDPPLSEDELAFYDAVSQNESAVELQGEDVLAKIARDLVAVMRRDIKTDWTVRDDVRAKLRSSIKRLLVLNKYPPDKQPEAIRLVIEQMESMAMRYAA